jgi:hypothetical protein
LAAKKSAIFSLPIHKYGAKRILSFFDKSSGQLIPPSQIEHTTKHLRAQEPRQCRSLLTSAHILICNQYLTEKNRYSS